MFSLKLIIAIVSEIFYHNNNCYISSVITCYTVDFIMLVVLKSLLMLLLSSLKHLSGLGGALLTWDLIQFRYGHVNM